jgi:ligand-binding sensor domain-containing protein
MIKRVLTFSDNIQHLHSTSEGLWIGHQGGVTFLEPRLGTAKKWTTCDGLPALPVLHVATEGERVAVATPNGIAWSENARGLVDGSDGARWQQGLMHPLGAGAYVNGVAFVQGRIYAATGGGRLYREGTKNFELVELPLKQARLVRLLLLPSPKKTLRLLLITNNSGVLMLATGGTEEPSLYQWSEEEGLCSRYVTALGTAGDQIAVAVHGCVHVAPLRTLVERPDELSRWGRIQLGEITGPAEHNRVTALCEHNGMLYIGSSAGMFRVAVTALGQAAEEPVQAERIDDGPVRHLASCRGELWAVQGSGLGRFVDGTAASRSETPEPESRSGGLRSRLFRGRFGGRTPEPVFSPSPVVVGARRLRFVPDSRWRGVGSEPECRQILTLASSPEGLAVGGEAGRVSFNSGERWSTEIVARLRRPPEVHSLVYDAENASFWAATRYGLYQRDPRGRWHRDLTFPGRTVHALCAWGGSIVALGSAGLHLFVQNEWTEISFPGDAPALFVAATSDTALALAGRPGTPFHIWKSGSPHPESVAIPVGRANCMAWGEGGELWLGADRGLTRWDRSRTETSVWNDERRDHVTSVLVHRGKLFVGSQAGLWVAPLGTMRAVTGAELEAQGERFGLLQGLPDAHVTSLVEHDGAIWVGTQGGLALLA